MELFMLGDAHSAIWNVFRTKNASVEPTDEEVTKFIDESHGRVIAAPFEKIEDVFRRLGEAGEAHTQELRGQEGIENGSLHRAPVQSTRSAGDAEQVVRYVPDYW